MCLDLASCALFFDAFMFHPNGMDIQPGADGLTTLKVTLHCQQSHKESHWTMYIKVSLNNLYRYNLLSLIVYNCEL